MRFRKNHPFIAFSLAFLFLNFSSHSQTLETVFEKSKGTQTPEYAEIIAFYKQLDQISSKFAVKEMGMSDAGYPLHLLLFSNDGKFDPGNWHALHKTVLLINMAFIPASLMVLMPAC